MMASRTLFQAIVGAFIAPATARNHEGAPAYAMPAREALAQYAATGCLNHTFYASDRTQLDRVRALATDLDPAFVAKTALYARERGHMKDMPALLTAMLAARRAPEFDAVF